MTNAHPPEEMGALIRETFRAMLRGVESQFDGSETTLSQWLTLKLIHSERIGCIGDINRELGLDSGAATRLVDQLETRKLLTRTRSTADRRVVGISLTQKGREIIHAMRPRLATFWEDRLKCFNADEKDTLFALLSRLKGSLLRSEGEEEVPRTRCEEYAR